jgi:hypothetical protein
MPNNRFDRGPRLRRAKKGIDDWDKSASLVVGEASRRSTSSLDPIHVRVLIVALAIVAAPAFAADFRGSELGGSCDSVSKREQALGSKEIGDLSSTNQHRFTGRAFDRDALITYLCKNDSLALIDLHLGPYNYHSAVAGYRAAYAALSERYGTPFSQHAYDQTEPNDQLPPQDGGKPGRFAAYWEGPGFHSKLTLWVVGDRAGPNWQVFAVFTPKN